MITEERAAQLVEALLERRRGEVAWMALAPELAILRVEEHPHGWLVFWQSAEFVRTRDRHTALIGSGPYLVDRQDGSIHHIPTTTYVGGGWEELYLRQVKHAQADAGASDEPRTDRRLPIETLAGPIL
ncbi:YrhB domain-containing protein [Kitasatospora sp. NPDC059673]|uniref:YrhB domain-containing protein n=1 Tax=Kitasatospora sp. NPDC059673 TaxID=3346901 RepID=UPI00368832BD